MKKLLYFILMLCIFCLPNISQASTEMGVLDNEINVDLWPENPQPYESVTITLSSYATDLSKAIIDWQIGPKMVQTGYGKTTYSFQTLGPDTTTLFNITITPEGSTNRISKQITITSSEVEIMYESVDGYTPPFYKGRTLITKGSNIKAVAIPNTNSVTSGKGKISYTWKQGDNTILGSSGYNKDSFVFKNDDLNKSEDITVSASSLDGKYNAKKTIKIPTIDPKILFYKKSPTEGIFYNNALTNNFFMEEDEMTISAEPYFLALNNKASNLDYLWKINGEQIDTPSKKTELTIRPNSRGGYATISLMIENLDELFQKVTNQLKIKI